MGHNELLLDVDIKELNIDELEILKNDEKAYLDNVDVLLEALLNMPFKRKGKSEELLKIIKVHEQNISLINNKIIDLEPTTTMGFMSWGNSIIGSSMTTTFSSLENSNMRVKLIEVKYVDRNKKIVVIEILDDIFKSELGNYYVQTDNGYMFSLNRIIEIEIGSDLSKWFDKINREIKLKRILDEKN